MLLFDLLAAYARERTYDDTRRRARVAGHRARTYTCPARHEAMPMDRSIHRRRQGMQCNATPRHAMAVKQTRGEVNRRGRDRRWVVSIAIEPSFAIDPSPIRHHIANRPRDKDARARSLRSRSLPSACMRAREAQEGRVIPCVRACVRPAPTYTTLARGDRWRIPRP